MDERIDERNDVCDEVGPAVGWSQRERCSPAQRVVAALPVGHVSQGLGERKDLMPAVFGYGMQSAAQRSSVNRVDAAEDPHVSEVRSRVLSLPRSIIVAIFSARVRSIG